MNVKERVRKTIDRIRPSLQAAGGDVELVDGDEKGIVTVRLIGACYGCPMAQLTLKNDVKRLIKQDIPEIKAVVSA